MEVHPRRRRRAAARKAVASVPVAKYPVLELALYYNRDAPGASRPSRGDPDRSRRGELSLEECATWEGPRWWKELVALQARLDKADNEAKGQKQADPRGGDATLLGAGYTRKHSRSDPTRSPMAAARLCGGVRRLMSALCSLSCLEDFSEPAATAD